MGGAAGLLLTVAELYILFNVRYGIAHYQKSVGTLLDTKPMLPGHAPVQGRYISNLESIFVIMYNRKFLSGDMYICLRVGEFIMPVGIVPVRKFTIICAWQWIVYHPNLCNANHFHLI